MPILPAPERALRLRWRRTGCAALGLLCMPMAHGADEGALGQSVRQWLQHEMAAEPVVQPEPAAAVPAGPASSPPLELRAIYGVGARLRAEFLAGGVALHAQRGMARLRGADADATLALLEIRPPCARLRRAGGASAEVCILPADESDE